MKFDFETPSHEVPMDEKTHSSESPSSPIISESVEMRPCDSRCRYSAQIARADKPLPLPVDVEGAPAKLKKTF